MRRAPNCFLAPRRRLLGCAIVLLCHLLSLSDVFAATTDMASAFDEANKLYEQGEYVRAAEAYQALLEENPRDTTLLFNLGNAWFKAERPGQAIAAYRRAQRLDPRDPDLRFNLGFVRKQVTGDDTTPGSFVHNVLTKLTLNEWTLFTSAGLWGFFTLLICKELRPKLAPALRNYTLVAGMGTVLLGGCLSVVAYDHFTSREAVVTVQEAIVRYGPLKESQVNYQLVAGSEVTVLDRKTVSSAELPETWLQIEDNAGRRGWLRESQVEIIH